MFKKITIIFALLLIVLFIYFKNKEDYFVLHVIDGDTISVLHKQKKLTIRLHGIDAPEKSQKFGIESKNTLSSKIERKYINLKSLKEDLYKRKIAIVFLKNRNINLEMLSEGMAWHYKQYNKSLIFSNEEKNAKSKKIGLWKDKNPIPPWTYRKTHVANKSKN